MKKPPRRVLIAAGATVLLAAAGVVALLGGGTSPDSFSRDLVVMLKYELDTGEALPGLDEGGLAEKPGALKEFGGYRRARLAGGPAVSPGDRTAASRRISTSIARVRRLLAENQGALPSPGGGGFDKATLEKSAKAIEPWKRCLWDYMTARYGSDATLSIWGSERMQGFLDRVESDARVMAEQSEWESKQGGQPR